MRLKITAVAAPYGTSERPLGISRLANANFAKLGHDDFGRVTTAIPAKRVDLATKQTLAAGDGRCFVLTTRGNAKLNGLHAAARITKAKRLGHICRCWWRAANRSWCFTANGRWRFVDGRWCFVDRCWGFAANWLRCTAWIAAVLLAEQTSGNR